MEAAHVLWFVIGLAIGWITKIPFLLGVYKDLERKYDLMLKMRDEINVRQSNLHRQRCSYSGNSCTAKGQAQTS